MLRADDVRYKRSFWILRGISLELDHGRIAIIGPNGSGKSTLAMILSGLWKPTRGTVTADGEDPKGKVYLAFQDARLPDLTVREYLKLVGDVRLLPRLGVEDVLDRKARRLSLGRKKRIHLQAAYSSRHRYVILDEPEAGIDSLDLVVKTIKAIEKPMIYITHEPSLLKLADRVYRLNNGKLTLYEDNR